MGKELKLKFRRFLGLIPIFVEVKGEKLVSGCRGKPFPPSPFLNRVKRLGRLPLSSTFYILVLVLYPALYIDIRLIEYRIPQTLCLIFFMKTLLNSISNTNHCRCALIFQFRLYTLCYRVNLFTTFHWSLWNNHFVAETLEKLDYWHCQWSAQQSIHCSSIWQTACISDLCVSLLTSDLSLFMIL